MSAVFAMNVSMILGSVCSQVPAGAQLAMSADASHLCDYMQCSPLGFIISSSTSAFAHLASCGLSEQSWI